MSKPYTLRPILDHEAEGEAVAEILSQHPEVTRSFDLRDVDGDPAGILLRGPEGWWFFYDSLRRWGPAYPTRAEALVALDKAVEALPAPQERRYLFEVSQTLLYSVWVDATSDTQAEERFREIYDAPTWPGDDVQADSCDWEWQMVLPEDISQ